MPTTPSSEFPVVAEISDDGDRVNINFDYSPTRVAAIKRVPSRRFVPKEKGGPFWRVNLDLATMRRLREEFGDELGLGEKLRAWGVAEVSKERNLSDLSQADDAELENVPARMIKGCKPKDGGRKFQLRPYQKADIKFMANVDGGAINANQPGAGKTIETIGALFEAGMELGQHLVIAPVQSLQEVWALQIRLAYDCAGYDEPTILTGETPEERREAVAEAKRLADDDRAFWLVINPYMARLKRQKVEGTSGDSIEYEEVPVAPELHEIDWDSIVVDEFHLMGLSNPTTLGARGVNELAETTQPTYRFPLSGTPMGGKPIKLWGALHFIDPAKFSSRWNWARHWLVINSNGYGSSIEGIMPGREVDFYNHLKPYLVRRTKREALPGLPPKNRIDVWCHMTESQANQYKTFATEAEWRIDDAEESGRLSATNILAEYTRLKQFADAYCEVHKTGRDNNGVPEIKVSQTADSGKLDQLLLKLEEENVIVSGSDDDDEPKCALIFSQFNEMVGMVTDALNAKGVPTAALGPAGAQGKKRNEIVKAFTDQTEGAPRVLVLNTMAGTALNLSQADSVHILDETWVPDNQEQAEDRAHRGDDKTMAKDGVNIYYYRTRGTIEEYVQKLVADKELNNRTILDLRRRMQKAAEKEAKASGE